MCSLFLAVLDPSYPFDRNNRVGREKQQALQLTLTKKIQLSCDFQFLTFVPGAAIIFYQKMQCHPVTFLLELCYYYVIFPGGFWGRKRKHGERSHFSRARLVLFCVRVVVVVVVRVRSLMRCRYTPHKEMTDDSILSLSLSSISAFWRSEKSRTGMASSFRVQTGIDCWLWPRYLGLNIMKIRSFGWNGDDLQCRQEWTTLGMGRKTINGQKNN